MSRVASWQARERPLEPLVQLAASEIVLRPTEHVEIEITDQDTVAAPPPRPAMADVARDRAQPAVGPTRLPKPVTMTPRLKQRLLRQVLGDRMIARDDRAEPNQPPALRIKPRSLAQHRRHDHISRPGHANQRHFSYLRGCVPRLEGLRPLCRLLRTSRRYLCGRWGTEPLVGRSYRAGRISKRGRRACWRRVRGPARRGSDGK